MSFDELNLPLKIAEAHIAQAMETFVRVLGPESARKLALSLISDYAPAQKTADIVPIKFYGTCH